MIEKVFIQNPIIILFLIIVVGYLLGRIRIGSFKLGVAGALFAGIALSALNPHFALPTFIYVLGLILFVYTTGLALGPAFFAGLKKTGLRDVCFVGVMLLFGAISAVVAAKIIGLTGPMGAGMYTGAFTVTPALASVLEALDGSSTLPIVGYSIAYPFSVIISLLVLGQLKQRWRVVKTEKSQDTSLNPRTVRYTRNEPVSVDELAARTGVKLSVSRLRADGELSLAKPSDIIEKGDLVTIVSTAGDYKIAAKWMGEVVSVKDQLESQEGRLMHRRVFVSSTRVAGRRLGEIGLYGKFDVVATRVRRGDVDMIVRKDFILELGDRIRLVGKHEALDKAADYLGDSYKTASEINIFAFAGGIVLGCLLGVVKIPLPGGSEFSLGAAGGTIIVALVLGRLRRTGPIAWQIPYSTNLALRQLGLLIFLAGVGSQAGGALVKALGNPASYQMIVAVLIVVTTTCLLMMFIGYRLLGISYTRLSGMLAAMNTQPATLAYANEQTKTDEANAGYASVYPFALVGKIIIAQIVLIVLSA